MKDALGHVLLVDDEPGVPAPGRACCRLSAIALTIAGDAEAAVARFREAKPDIVLLEPRHAAQSDAGSRVGSHPAVAGVPVIVITVMPTMNWR